MSGRVGASSQALDARLVVAEQIARDAGALLATHHQRTDLIVETKSSTTDMVSEMDRAAEDLIVGALTTAFADDAILGEEGTTREGTTGFRWVIDPLDGTTNYLYRYPLWAVSIGCEFDGVSVVGAVYAPTIDAMWTARSGKPAHRNGVPIHVSKCTDPAIALIATGFGYAPEVRRAQGAAVAALLPQVRDIRRGGSAAIDLCFVAEGLVDGYYEQGINPWDSCAGIAIIRSAEGVVTGRETEEANRELTVAGNPAIQGWLRAQLR